MTYRPNLALQPASVTKAGVIKADGTTLVVAPDATASVVGTVVTALTDISSGTLGGPAGSDVDTVNRAGTDYKVTLSARAALFRKTPAGSRTISLAAGSTIATLTSSDNDKQVVVTGVAGSLAADGSVADGFRCLVINKTSAALSYTGISGLGGVTSLPTGSASQVYLAASALESMSFGGGSYSLPAATTSSLGGVKPDGTSLSAATDGTLSVVTVTTHSLPLGTATGTADEIAAYSSASNSDVKYSLGQIANFALSNIQSWTTTTRPSPSATQFTVGYNTTLGRFDFWNGSGWDQYIRVADLSASPATVPVISVASSGSSQALAFPTSGSRAYDVTLTANCTFTLSGGAPGELQTLSLIVRGGAGGFAVTLPSNVKWKGGSAPAVDTSAGSLFLIRIQTSDGGATYAGNF